MICEMMMEPDISKEVLMNLAKNQLRVVEQVTKYGFGITLFESSATPPLLSPMMFDDFVNPAIDEIFNYLNENDVNNQLVIGGNTLPVLNSILEVKPQYIICPYETDQDEFMKQAPVDSDLLIRLNMNPAVFVGNKEDAIKEAERVFEIAEQYSNTSIGSLLPYNADKDIVQAVAEYIMGK